MTDPFRSELDAAHRRIEQLQAEHRTRVEELERDNARLRERLIDTGQKRNATGRTFAALGMIILGVSLMAGILFARVVQRPSMTAVRSYSDAIELPSESSVDAPSASPSDFDRSAVADALAHVQIADCVKPDAVRTTGHIKLTIAPSGVVTFAHVDEGPTGTSSVARCVEDCYRAARVPPFSGPSRSVGNSFAIP